MSLLSLCMCFSLQGIFFENDSIWSNILGTSPMVDPLVKPLSKTADCVLKLPNFPSASVGDTNAMQVNVLQIITEMFSSCRIALILCIVCLCT